MTIASISHCLLAALPEAEQIRQKAAEVVARPEFQLDSGVRHETISLWLRIIRLLLSPFSWLSRVLQGLPSPLWWLVVILLTLLSAALIFHLSWTLLRAIRGPLRKGATLVSSEVGVTAEDLERAAAEAEARGDFIGAIRFLFRAGLRRIEKAEDMPIRRGITNHELLRRYRKSPLSGPLQWFVDTIDAKWYGHGVCDRDDCQASRAEYSRICGVVERRRYAVGT